MSVLQTIGTRQSTFTVDSPDVKAASGNGEVEIPVGRDTSADSRRSCGIDLSLDNHVSSKKVKREAAKKHRLTTTNSRLSEPAKPQLNIDKTQAGTSATSTHQSIDSNTDASAKLSSSVRKRLRHIHRIKTDVSLLKQAGEHTGQTNETVPHDDSYSEEHSRPRVLVNDPTPGGVDNICVVTSGRRKTVSFDSNPAIYIDRPTVQLGENHISHKNVTKSTRNSSDLHPGTHSTPTTQKPYHRSVEQTSADQSQVFLHETAEPQIHRTSTPLHPVGIENRASSPSWSHTSSLPNNADISGISKTLSGHIYSSNKFTKRRKEIHVNEDDSFISETYISDHNEKVLHGQTKRSLEELTAESVSNKAGSHKNAISEFHASPDTNNLRSSEKIGSHSNSQKTTLIPALPSAARVANKDVQTSGLILSRYCHETEQKLICPLLDDSSPSKQQTTAPFISLETERDRDHVLLENNERTASNSKKYSKQTKHKNDNKTVAESVENTPRFVAESVENLPKRDVQLIRVVHSKMARSGKFDYVNETFEDVLTERNDMAKTERVYRMRIRQLEEELKQMVRQCQDLSNENKELRKTLDGMKATMEKSNKGDMLSKLTKLETEKAQLGAEYNKILKQMDSVTTDSEKIKTVNAELENTVRELEQQLRSLNAQIKSQESEKARNMESQIRDLQSTLKHLDQEKKAVEAKIVSLEYDNTSLTDSLENRRREIEDLTNSLHARTVTEANLKGLQDENHHLKQDLTEMNEKFRGLEASKQQLQDLFSEQDNTFKQLKTDNDEKDKIIAQLRRDSEVSMQDIKKQNELQQASREKEKESLVSRIASLKTEIDSSLSENYKMKQEREEMAKIMEKLRQDNLIALESCKESKKYLRKWEQEKEYRAKVEDDLDKKKEEAVMLEIRVKEAEKRVDFLNERVKSLENEHEYPNNPATSNRETNNKGLMDRNMKLRQMLVERNIELTNTKHEQTITDSRIQHLERKQKSAEVKVKQLAEYLGSVVYINGQESITEATQVVLTSPNKKSPLYQSHKNILPSQPHKHISKQSPRKVTEPSPKDIGGDEGDNTTSSLPFLQPSSASGLRPRNGYVALYRQKRTCVKGKGYM